MGSGRMPVFLVSKFSYWVRTIHHSLVTFMERYARLDLAVSVQLHNVNAISRLICWQSTYHYLWLRCTVGLCRRVIIVYGNAAYVQGFRLEWEPMPSRIYKLWSAAEEIHGRTETIFFRGHLAYKLLESSVCSRACCYATVVNTCKCGTYYIYSKLPNTVPPI